MVRERIEELYSNIEKCALLAGRDPQKIVLVAVTKTQPLSLIREAYEA